MSRVCLAVCLVVLAAAPGAAASVYNAQSVLPPGQSGFVSRGGLATGSGSRHLLDQLPLLTGFRFKPATFGLPGESTEEPRQGVTIVRDAYGVPSITATTE